MFFLCVTTHSAILFKLIGVAKIGWKRYSNRFCGWGSFYLNFYIFLHIITIEAKKQEVGKLSAKADEKLRDFYTIKERGNWQDPMFFAMSAYIYRIDEGLQFCIKAIQDYAYSGFGGRGGKHGDIFWDNESFAIKQYMKMFADLASATLKQVADWFVWLASTLGRFNANELRRADHEVHDIADGRYDGRIQKFQQGISR